MAFIQPSESKKRFGYAMSMVKELSVVKEFRIRSRRFFLTYPQLPAEAINLEEIAISNYERIFSMKRSDFHYVACVELHGDGNPHLHVYLEFASVQKIYSANKLDLIIDGYEEPFHGNYQAVKSERATIEYIMKAGVGQVKTNKKLPIVNGVYYSNCEEHLNAVLRASGLAEAKNVLFDQYPREAIRRGNHLLLNLIGMSSHLQELRSSTHVHVYDLTEFQNISATVWRWVENPSIGTLVLYGPSGTGKTELAKALLKSMGLNYIIIGDKNSLRKFDVSLHQAIIFDDMNFEPIAREELIALLDTHNGGDIRILYSVVHVPGYVARIFTTNRPQNLFQHDSALERRAVPVEVTEPVWNALVENNLVKIEDRAYRSYRFNQEDIHPVFWNSNYPSVSDNVDRVVNVERPEPTTLDSSVSDNVDRVVNVERPEPTNLDSNIINIENVVVKAPTLKLLAAGVVKSRRGRPKRIFKIDTSIVVKIAK